LDLFFLSHHFSLAQEPALLPARCVSGRSACQGRILPKLFCYHRWSPISVSCHRLLLSGFCLPPKELLPADVTARSSFCCLRFVPCSPAVMLFWSWLRSLGRLHCSHHFCPLLAQNFPRQKCTERPGVCYRVRSLRRETRFQ
jgi:hypothetical protein